MFADDSRVVVERPELLLEQREAFDHRLPDGIAARVEKRVEEVDGSLRLVGDPGGIRKGAELPADELAHVRDERLEVPAGLRRCLPRESEKVPEGLRLELRDGLLVEGVLGDIVVLSVLLGPEVAGAHVLNLGEVAVLRGESRRERPVLLTDGVNIVLRERTEHPLRHVDDGLLVSGLPVRKYGPHGHVDSELRLGGGELPAELLLRPEPDVEAVPIDALIKHGREIFLELSKAGNGAEHVVKVLLRRVDRILSVRRLGERLGCGGSDLRVDSRGRGGLRVR